MSGETNDKCRQVREMLSGFLDDELSCDVSHGIQEHLERCPPCDRVSRADQAFNSALKACVRRIEAPDGFASAVMARLDRGEWSDLGTPQVQAPPAPAPASLPRRRVLKRAGYALAAAAGLTLLLAPVAARVMPGFIQKTVDSFHGVRTASGVLVCVECERLGATIEHQRLCRLQGHHTGFKSPDSGVWSLVVNDASLPLMSDPSVRGTQVTVEGRFLQDIRYLDARRITPNTRAGAPSAPCAPRTDSPIITSWQATSSSSTTVTSPRKSLAAIPQCWSISPRSGAAPARSSTLSLVSSLSPTRAG